MYKKGVRASFLIKFQASACNFNKKAILAQLFSCEFCKILRTPFLQNTSGRLLPYSERSPNLFLNIHICICSNLLIQEVSESHHQSNKIRFLLPSTLYDIFWQSYSPLRQKISVHIVPYGIMKRREKLYGISFSRLVIALLKLR